MVTIYTELERLGLPLYLIEEYTDKIGIYWVQYTKVDKTDVGFCRVATEGANIENSCIAS
jgi:hypothetical protein